MSYSDTKRRLSRLCYILGHDVPWWFKHRFVPWHRYHIINTGLQPGWHDTDRLLEVVIKKLVVDFVELEKPFEGIDVDAFDDGFLYARLQTLYEALKRVDIDDIDYDELTGLLTEAVALRGIMWT